MIEAKRSLRRAFAAGVRCANGRERSLREPERSLREQGQTISKRNW